MIIDVQGREHGESCEATLTVELSLQGERVKMKWSHVIGWAAQLRA